MSASDALVVCENLVKIYSLAGVEVMALQGLDLSVRSGEILGIVGASGSGKSTLLNVLGGLDRPSAGHVQVGERDLLKLSDADLDVYRRTQVGFVWQQTTRNLVPYLTAQENVELPLRLTRHSRAERRRRALELLEMLGLSHRFYHLPAQLSGGEQQRVAIAVALANQPLVLLADEPTGELDTATALEIYAALREMNLAYGMTTIVVSHDPNIAHHTDRVVAIRDGKTSTEMVRYTRRAAIESKESHKPKSAEFEELIVLDSAGRLQIPREHLERLDIGDRVRLELGETSITLHPVAGRGRHPAASSSDAAEPHVDDQDAALQVRLHPWFARLRARVRFLHRQEPEERT